MQDEKAVLEAYLKKKSLKMTSAREAVLNAFLEREGHLTAEELLEATRLLVPGIGQATVFRTIKLLAEAGLAQEACRDDGARQFEHAFRHAHHDHLVCDSCGAVIEFVDKRIERALEAIYQEHGYESSGHRLELRGRCPSCAMHVKSKETGR